MKMLTYNGKTQSIHDWSAEIGVSIVTLYKRIQKGYTIDLILASDRGVHVKKWDHGGKSMTLRQWAKEVGLCLGTLKSRLKKGWTFEQAITTPRGKSIKSAGSFGKQVVFDGQSKNLQHWSFGLGGGRTMVAKRIEYGWGLNEALTTPINNRGRKKGQSATYLTHNGKTQSVIAWAKETGLSPNCIYVRLRKGMSIADAVTLPPKNTHRKGKRIEREL